LKKSHLSLLLQSKAKQALHLLMAQHLLRVLQVLLLRATPNLRRKPKWRCSVARSDLSDAVASLTF
jgi:hypothetical protein